MSNENKHGLTRHIGADVTRIVRQECGNGCVICGRLPYHYDHFDPEFDAATEHRAAGIALLCPSHHQDRTSRRLSVENVRRARLRPKNADRDALWSFLLSDDPVVLFGTNEVRRPRHVLSRQGGRPYVEFLRSASGDLVMNAAFADAEGALVLEIVENELRVKLGVWDFSMEGPRLRILRGAGDVALEVDFNAEIGTIYVRRLNMLIVGGMRLEVTSEAINVYRQDGRLMSSMTGSVFQGNAMIFG